MISTLFIYSIVLDPISVSNCHSHSYNINKEVSTVFISELLGGEISPSDSPKIVRSIISDIYLKYKDFTL